MSTRSRSPCGASTSVYAPRGTPSAARSAVPSSTGTFWRVRMNAVGPSPSMWIRHASAVSLASAGRINRSPGIARIAASCSIG